MSEWQAPAGSRGTVIAVAVALVLAGAALAGRSGTGRPDDGGLVIDTDPGPGPGDPAVAEASGHDRRGSWHVLPDAPISARRDPQAVWTGAEVIVWGGSDEDGLLRDGAVYDPERDRWRRMAEPPRRPLEEGAVWTGQEMLVLGEGGGVGYDPVTNRWRVLPSAPEGDWRWSGVGWSGEEAVVLSGQRAAGYDPVSDSWRLLPEPPVADWPLLQAVTVQDVLVVYGREPTPPVQGVLAAFAPREDAWVGSSPVPVEGQWRAVLAAAPASPQVAVAGGMVERPDRTAAHRWRRGWSQLPDLPEDLAGGPDHLAWAGEGLIAWSAGVEPRVLLQPRRPEAPWREMADFPLAGRRGAATAWTGRELVVWGGQGAGDLHADGALLRLPGDEPFHVTPLVGDPPDLTGSWRRLPAGPELEGDLPDPVWTGEEALVLANRLQSPITAGYDPDGTVWRGVAAGGPSATTYRAAVWTGDVLVTVATAGISRAPRPLTAAVYDPAEDTWHDVAAPSGDTVGPVTATWTGEEMIVLSGESAGVRADALDPQTGAWRRLRPRMQAGGFATAEWTGEEVLTLGSGRSQHVQRYDPESNRWRRAADSPLGARERVASGWTGEEWVVWAAEGGGEPPAGAAYDPARDAWRRLPEPGARSREVVGTGWERFPLLARAEEQVDGHRSAYYLYDGEDDTWRLLSYPPGGTRRPMSALWTGDQLLVWTAARAPVSFTPSGDPPVTADGAG